MPGGGQSLASILTRESENSVKGNLDLSPFPLPFSAVPRPREFVAEAKPFQPLGGKGAGKKSVSRDA